MDDNRNRVYHIPTNVFDGISFLGIGARHWIEAAVLAFLPGWAFWKYVHFEDFSLKIIVMLIVCLPLTIFALVGYNGESLTQFVRTAYRFWKNRRILEYMVEDEEAAQEGGLFADLEEEITSTQTLIDDTRDKKKLKELKSQIKLLKKELKGKQTEVQKAQAAEDAEMEKEREKKRKEETDRADALADKEIQRRRSEGEKINKKAAKAIQAEFRAKYVLEMPTPPKEDDGIQRNISSQEFMPIDRIEDRCIITKGGRFIRILCVAPINFPMLSVGQQNYTIDQFAIMLKGSPINIQIKTMAKSADVEGFIERMQDKIREESSEKCVAMMKDYINTLRINATQNAVSRQFFLILEYDESQSTKNTTDRERKMVLETAVSKAKQQFKRCNNTVYEFENESDEVDFIYSIFFDLMERFNAYGMNNFDKIDYAYAQAASAPNRALTASDFIAPLSIDLTNHRYAVIDGVYYGYMYIPSKGYRSDVWGSWLFNAINAGGGVDVDIFLTRGDKDKVRSAARRQINLGSAQLKDSNVNTDAFDFLVGKTRAAQYIKDGLLSNEDFFYVTTVVTVIAMSESALFSRMANITSMFEDMDMTCIPANFHVEDAFLGTLPLCKVPDSIYELGHRNMLTSGAASMYPFASYELMDDNGILVGTNITNGSLVMPDVFDGKKYKNANMFILGSSGAGKSYSLMTQALRTREQGIQVFILAPVKGHEFKRSCEAIGGQYIKIAPGSAHCINAMSIRKRDEEAIILNRLLDGSDVNDSILSEKISSLETLFEIMVPDISDEEAQLLNGHMMKTYEKFGITEDNNSLYDPANPTEYRLMPTLADLHEQMADDPIMNRIRNIMSKYVTGSAKNFSAQTNVSLENPYTVIDMTALEKNKKMLAVGMYIALDYMWDKIKEDRTKNKRIFIDEIWSLIGVNASVTSAQFVNEIFKTIRGYGGGAVAATQELEDYFALNGGTYGKAILNACTLGMVMKTEATSMKLLKEALDLEQREVDIIQGFERGQALIVGGGSSVAVKVVASNKEHDLITTNTHDLQRIAREELKRQAEARESLGSGSFADKPLIYKQESDEVEPEAMTPGELLAASRKQQKFVPMNRKKVRL